MTNSNFGVELDGKFSSLESSIINTLPRVVVTNTFLKPAGTIVYDLTTKSIFFSDGLEWQPLGGSNANVHITATTASTSPTTGALVVDGGTGIGGDLWVRGGAHFGDTGDVLSTEPYVNILAGGAASTSTTIRGQQTPTSITLLGPVSLPGNSGTLLTDNSTATLTNKTITDASNNVAANSLKTTGASVNVSAAIPPVVGQSLIATSATTATWQTPGSTSLGFGHFFGLAPPDYAATIAVGAPLPFPSDGSAGGSTPIVRASATTFVLPVVGSYLVNWQVGVDEAGQFMLSTTDLGALANTVSSRATGTSLITNSVIVSTVVDGDVLSVINPAGNATALTVTPSAGGLTHAPSPSLTILRLL